MRESTVKRKKEGNEWRPRERGEGIGGGREKKGNIIMDGQVTEITDLVAGGT